MARVLLAVPDPDEAAALLSDFTRLGISANDIAVGGLTCTSLPALNAILAVCGNGKTQFGVQAQYLIDRCPDTRLLLCVGAAGSLSDDVRIGDVVVADVTIEHDYKRRMSSKPLPRHEADAVHVQRFMHVAAQTARSFQVHSGAIASGDEDIVDPARAAEVRAATGALCVAWEGSGGARAARVSGIGFCEIRGITDLADDHAARHFHENLGSVMPHVGELLLAWSASEATL
jgi:adenosylhomocysteine nucleosidase